MLGLHGLTQFYRIVLKPRMHLRSDVEKTLGPLTVVPEQLNVIISRRR